MAIYNWKWQPGDFLKALAFFWILWNFINYYYFDYEKRICPRAVLRLLKDSSMECCQDFKFLCQDTQLFWWEVAGVMGSIYSFGKETSSISHSLWGCFTSLEWGQLSHTVAHQTFLTKAALYSMGMDLAAPFHGQGVSSSKQDESRQGWDYLQPVTCQRITLLLQKALPAALPNK